MKPNNDYENYYGFIEVNKQEAEDYKMSVMLTIENGVYEITKLLMGEGNV